MGSPLHEYQRRAIRFALNAFASPARGCGLFMEPGLGKTLTSIAIMDIMHAADPRARFLVVAPALVARNSWPDEFERWKDMHSLTWAVAAGTPKQRDRALEAGADVTIIGQDNLKWLDGKVKAWPWTGLVVDELSGYRTPRSNRGLVLRRHARKAAWTLGLTGTPATKNLLDLWGEIAVIDRSETLERSMTRYRDRWFTPTRYIDMGGRRQPIDYTPRDGAQREILDLIEPFCLSMKASDRLPGLPSMIETDHWLDMPDATRDTYDRLRREMVADLDDGTTVTVANAGVLTAKLAQLTCGCLYPDTDDPDGTVGHTDSVKLDALAGIVDAADGPVLVFYQFKDELERMRARFPGMREVHEKGVLEEWRRGRVPLLAAHPQAAKYGLNIQDGGARDRVDEPALVVRRLPSGMRPPPPSGAEKDGSRPPAPGVGDRGPLQARRAHRPHGIARGRHGRVEGLEAISSRPPQFADFGLRQTLQPSVPAGKHGGFGSEGARDGGEPCGPEPVRLDQRVGSGPGDADRPGCVRRDGRLHVIGGGSASPRLVPAAVRQPLRFVAPVVPVHGHAIRSPFP